MKTIVLFLFVSVWALVETNPQNINSTQAQQHIGDTLWVEGVVNQVSINKNAKGKPAYLNFGGRFPNHHFTVLIWTENHPEIEPATVLAYEGKKVRVYGLITEYRGKPQIVYGKGVEIELL